MRASQQVQRVSTRLLPLSMCCMCPPPACAQQQSCSSCLLRHIGSHRLDAFRLRLPRDCCVHPATSICIPQPQQLRQSVPAVDSRSVRRGAATILPLLDLAVAKAFQRVCRAMPAESIYACSASCCIGDPPSHRHECFRMKNAGQSRRLLLCVPIAALWLHSAELAQRRCSHRHLLLCMCVFRQPAPTALVPAAETRRALAPRKLPPLQLSAPAPPAPHICLLFFF